MNTSTVTPEIVAFAQGVRAALADLPADEVDDLTEGLEADLAEAYAEDLQRELPDPAAYAAELRAAAGLPMREKIRTGLLAGLASSWRDTRGDIAVAVRRNPALASVLDFVSELRPAWWIIRAWLATWLVAAFFGMERGYWFDGAWWLVLAVFVVISVQWGRGRWHGKAVPALIAIGNVFAVIALLPVLAAADDAGQEQYAVGFDEGVAGAANDPTPLARDGQPVTNIFAYDASGKLVPNVQLFDQQGKPLTTVSLGSGGGACANEDCTSIVQPVQLETGQSAFNVFPLSGVPADWDDNAQTAVPRPGATAVQPAAPFLKVPAVQDDKKVAKSNE